MSAWIEPVKFWKPGTMPAGMPVSRIASRSARAVPDCGELGEVREHARVERREQPGQLGVGDSRSANCLSSDGGCVFQWSFWPSGISTSLTSGLPRRDTWTNGPLWTFVADRRVPQLAPAGGSRSSTRRSPGPVGRPGQRRGRMAPGWRSSARSPLAVALTPGAPAR